MILEPPPTPLKSVAEVAKEVTFSGNLSQQQKQPFLQSLRDNLDVFQGSLPGYNHTFGPLYADFKFASKARPKALKLRNPNYGSQQDLFFNLKCMQLKGQEVLLDPMALNIQPLLTHNAWVVKKPSSASIPWHECTVKIVRLWWWGWTPSTSSSMTTLVR